MPLVTTTKMFEDAYKNGYAVGAFNVDNVDIMKAVYKLLKKQNHQLLLLFQVEH